MINVEFGKNKLYNHIDKIHNWINKDKTIITAELDVTNVCNNFCPGCTGFNENKQSINLFEVKSYIDQMVELGVRGLIFSGGGEPLCNKHTLDAIQYAKSKRLDIGLITNGLSMEISSMGILATCCTWIRISLDAGTPEIYKLTHGMNKESFQKVIENIGCLVVFCKGMINPPTIGTAFLTGENTLSDMLEFTKLSKSLGVDYAQFRPFHGDKTAIDKQLKECKLLATHGFSVLASVQKYSKFKDEEIRPYKKCYGINFRLVICADSKVYLCCHHRSKEKYCLGDLKKQSLREIIKNRDEIAKKIDFKECPIFCVLDKENRELWNIKEERQHKNFL